MSSILILGAMESEVASIVSHIYSHSHAIKHSLFPHCALHEGRLDNADVLVAACGVGKSMSALSCQRILDHCAEQGKRVSHIIFTGLAGALAGDLRIGDVLVAVDCVQHDFDVRSLGYERGEIPNLGTTQSGLQAPAPPLRFFACNEAMVEIAMSYAGSPADKEFRLKKGRVLTGDQFISNRQSEEYAYLASELGGDAVEMEGASVALCASINRIPFLLLRTVSDEADGKAKLNFRTFLPQASERALGIVRHICAELVDYGL